MKNNIVNNSEESTIKHFAIAQRRHLNLDRPLELAYAVCESQPQTELYGQAKLIADFKKPETTDKGTAYRNIIEEIRKHH